MSKQPPPPKKTTKKQKQMNHLNVWWREPLGFVPRMFGFIQPACNASIVNKTNSRKKCTQIYF